MDSEDKKREENEAAALDDMIIDKAMSRLHDDKRKGHEEIDNNDFIQPEGNALSLPADIRDRLQRKYGNLSHEGLCVALNHDIIELAQSLSVSMQSLCVICSSASTLIPTSLSSISSYYNSLELNAIDPASPESEWYFQIRNFVRRNSIKTGGVLGYTKLDIAAMIRQLHLEFDNVQYRFSEVHTEFLISHKLTELY